MSWDKSNLILCDALPKLRVISERRCQPSFQRRCRVRWLPFRKLLKNGSRPAQHTSKDTRLYLLKAESVRHSWSTRTVNSVSVLSLQNAG